jgi:hypothetical protein
MVFVVVMVGSLQVEVEVAGTLKRKTKADPVEGLADGAAVGLDQV